MSSPDFDLSIVQTIVEQVQAYSASLSNSRPDTSEFSLMTSLCKLKLLNSSISHKMNDKKRNVDDCKKKVDALHFKLGNLLYKKTYLIREISRLKKIETPELDLLESNSKTSLSTRDCNAIEQVHLESLEKMHLEKVRREEHQEKYILVKKQYEDHLIPYDQKRKFEDDDFPSRVQKIKLECQLIKEAMDKATSNSSEAN